MPEDEQDGEAPQPPPPPFAPEDNGYQSIVSEFVGLRRAGADPVSAALITAAHLMLLGVAAAGVQGPQEPEQEI